MLINAGWLTSKVNPRTSRPWSCLPGPMCRLKRQVSPWADEYLGCYKILLADCQLNNYNHLHLICLRKRELYSIKFPSCYTLYFKYSAKSSCMWVELHFLLLLITRSQVMNISFMIKVYSWQWFHYIKITSFKNVTDY